MVSQNGLKMPSSDANGHTKPTASQRIEESQARHSVSWSTLFAIPRPVKRIFDAFPLRTYAANELPVNIQRAQNGEGHALFIWCSQEDAEAGNASFNPACFRWQVSRTSLFFGRGDPILKLLVAVSEIPRNQVSDSHVKQSCVNV
jgi:hypothetical protein